MEVQTREPLLIGAALADSPVGTAGWISDKFLRWTDAHGGSATVADGVVGQDFLMDTITLYCATASVASSLWMYPGYTKIEQTMPGRLEVPTAIFALPNDPVFPWPPRSLLERHYQIRRWTTPPFGAHFAALETPDHLFADLVAFAGEVDETHLKV